MQLDEHRQIDGKDNAMLFKINEMACVEKIAENIHTITLSGGGQVEDQLKQLFVR